MKPETDGFSEMLNPLNKTAQCHISKTLSVITIPNAELCTCLASVYTASPSIAGNFSDSTSLRVSISNPCRRYLSLMLHKIKGMFLMALYKNLTECKLRKQK